MFFFFPVRDLNRPRRVPYVSWVIIGICVAVHFYVAMLDLDRQEVLFRTYGFTPGVFTKAFSVMLEEKPIMLLSPLTYIFVHGGWFHLISNMWAFWIYSDNVEDRMGHVRFLLFFFLCGFVAVAAHFVFNSGDLKPVVGASGALAGVMAAYLRLFPIARIQCFMWFIFIIRIIEVPALVVIVVWFMSQLMSVYTSMMGVDVGNVAWYAHVGGFLAGSWLTLLWYPRQSFRFLQM